MAFDFHSDKPVYFRYQYENAKSYLLPFLQAVQLGEGTHVLEIGSAEGGVLKAFTEIGCTCIGVELSESRVELAKKYMAEEQAKKSVRFINQDIYDINIEKEIGHRFDLIVLKDVIEHIHNQEKLLDKLHEFLKPGGRIFFGFPPWHMPFGGHQQVCEHRWLSKTPYFHLLPMPLYKMVLKAFGESKRSQDALVEIKTTGISLQRFERIVKKMGYQLDKKQLYLINPIYRYKFNIKPRNQFSILAAIPYLRDFFTTTAYYLISQKNIS